tara:strand:- start:5632 stop:7203 length:1572 start_codon:yes stop_codon:yes gene_type:complete
MALGAAARERQEFIKPENVLKRELVKEEEERQAKQKEQERKEAAQKKSDKQLADRQRAEEILRIAKEQNISATEAVKTHAAMGESTKAAPETDTTDLNFATTPAEAPQSAPVDYYSRARGNVYSGMAGAKEAYAKEQEAVREKTRLDQEGMDAIAQQRVDDADDYATEMGVLTNLQKAHKAGLDAYQEGTQKLEDDYNNRKIDPNRAFSSTGARVASAIAIALGAFAQGASRGKIPNTAFEIIEGAIKRDIDAQKTEMQKSRDVLLNRNNIYARMMARFQNEEVAFAATMTMGLKHAKMKIEGMIQKHKSANAQAGLEVILAGINTKIAESDKKGYSQLAEINVKQAQHQAKSGAAQTKRSESMKLAMKTLNLLPSLQRGFESITAMQAAWSVVLPKAAQEMFSGMKEAVVYDDSRNLNAKMLTKAFDGGRPTEKDFQIFVALFPGETADKKIASAKFNNIRQNLLDMLADSKSGGLEAGFLTGAWEQHYGEGGLSPQEKAAGSKLFDKQKKENWKNRFQQGN